MLGVRVEKVVLLVQKRSYFPGHAFSEKFLYNSPAMGAAEGVDTHGVFVRTVRRLFARLLVLVGFSVCGGIVSSPLAKKKVTKRGPIEYTLDEVWDPLLRRAWPRGGQNLRVFLIR